jgi:glutamate transport system permease protein
MGGEPMSQQITRAARVKRPRRTPTTSVLFDVPGPVAQRRNLLGGIVAGLAILVLLGLAIVRMIEREQITPDKWAAFANPRILQALAEALGLTLLAAIVAIACALVFGAIFAAGRLSDHRWLRWPSIAIVEFFRAIPLVLLIIFLFIAFGNITERYGALVIALTLYNGSVLAEIFRAGILAVPRGQGEAGYAIGLRKSGVMLRVLVPQAVSTMLPAIISQCVVALKDTALGLVISSPDVVSVARRIAINPIYDNILVVGLVLAAIFIAINYGLSRLAGWLEARQRRRGRAVVEVTNIPDAGMGGAATG